MVDDRTRRYLDTKKKGTRENYKSGFRLFRMYAEEELGREIAGSDLVRTVAQDRRKNIEDRERPESEILKGFFDWMREKAPKRRGSGRGLALKTCHMYLSSLTDFLNYNDLPVNKKRLGLPKPTKRNVNRKINVRKGQVRELVNHAKTTRNRAVILCLWQSGMSVGDLLDLDVRDVMIEDPTRGSLENPPLLVKLTRRKVGVEYRTFFGRDACKALKEYLEERGRMIGEVKRGAPLFLQQRKHGERYRRLTKNAVGMVFKRLVVRAGLVSEERIEEADVNPARTHALRAGFSSVLKEEGMNQSIIDGLQGHSVGYDSAYHIFTDEQLRDVYREHEDALSIERTSIPQEDEIERVVKKHFGEMGVERVMPDLEKTLNGLDSRLSKMEEEMQKREELLKVLTVGVEDLEKTGSLSEIVDELVEEKLRDTLKKEAEPEAEPKTA